MAGTELEENSFTVYIYEKDCTEEAYIDYPATASIEMIKVAADEDAELDTVDTCWSMAKLGFFSSE